MLARARNSPLTFHHSLSHCYNRLGNLHANLSHFFATQSDNIREIAIDSQESRELTSFSELYFAGGLPRNLKKLTLRADVPAALGNVLESRLLQAMPTLRHLELRNIYPKWDCIMHLSMLSSLEISNGSYGSLEGLMIHCPQCLRDIFESLPGLRKLVLEGCLSDWQTMDPQVGGSGKIRMDSLHTLHLGSVSLSSCTTVLDMIQVPSIAQIEVACSIFRRHKESDMDKILRQIKAHAYGHGGQERDWLRYGGSNRFALRKHNNGPKR